MALDIELRITEAADNPDLLCWRVKNNSDDIVVGGIFEVTTTDEAARLTACAAHVFNYVTVKKEIIPAS